MEKWTFLPENKGYYNLALQDSYSALLIRFKKCAMERIPQNAKKYAENLLPTLVDVAGMENENNELWKELLEIIFFGRLPKGEALHTAYKYGVEHGIQVNRSTKMEMVMTHFIQTATKATHFSWLFCFAGYERKILQK